MDPKGKDLKFSNNSRKKEQRFVKINVHLSVVNVPSKGTIKGNGKLMVSLEQEWKIGWKKIDLLT